MKNQAKYRIIFLFVTIVWLCGCAKEKDETINRNAGRNQKVEQEMDSAKAEKNPEESKKDSGIRESEKKRELDQTQNSQDVDVDLTILSSTMVYSEVYNMMFQPEDYVGKRIRMKGQFSVFEVATENNSEQKYYFACVIADAAACCQQGLGFALEDGLKKYPEDYPEPGTEITVTGVFEKYKEKEYSYYRMENAKLE